MFAPLYFLVYYQHSHVWDVLVVSQTFDFATVENHHKLSHGNTSLK